MQKNKAKKKKPIKLKKKKISKIKTKKKAKVLRTKKRKPKEEIPAVIFDSTLGNTDSLFVNEEEIYSPAQFAVFLPNPDNNPVLPESMLDPAIDEALKEFDALIVPKKEIQQEKQPAPVELEVVVEKPRRKSFWKSLFGRG